MYLKEFDEYSINTIEKNLKNIKSKEQLEKLTVQRLKKYYHSQQKEYNKIITKEEQYKGPKKAYYKIQLDKWYNYIMLIKKIYKTKCTNQ